ncbi:Tenascin-X [Holothuria leucospilota]|uniref:Tenascin-X n=1 Tax=Holothuria leucospilota TaxID=206669 RepID=A0A9Q1BRA2_HOLLE|nr:Tenascin-X [Holothuria leucospilota]
MRILCSMEHFILLQTFSIFILCLVVGKAHCSVEGSSYFFYHGSAYPRDCKEVQEQCTTSATSGVYLIKPEGYEEAFEVYCDNEVNGGGWTVFQRRNSNNSVEFNRNFSDYRDGFGFLSGEFWLGTERLSFLTNQKRYELRIDMVNSAGSSFYVTYDLFRIGDEWSNYKLTSVGQYDGTADNFISKCQMNATSGSCAVTPPLSDCYDYFTSGFSDDGVYAIKPNGWTESPFQVYCNMSHDGGWTVLQRRVNGSVDFYRDWDDYKEGFGTPRHELWLGNEKLFLLTNQKNYKLRIDVINRDGVPYYMNYDLFRVDNENSNYQLALGNYAGNAGYDYMDYHRGHAFTTRDRDNDLHYYYNCAVRNRGSWWYNGCYDANLNGDYSSTSDTGVALYNRATDTHQYSLRYTQMKIRPV